MKRLLVTLVGVTALAGGSVPALADPGTSDEQIRMQQAHAPKNGPSAPVCADSHLPMAPTVPVTYVLHPGSPTAERIVTYDAVGCVLIDTRDASPAPVTMYMGGEGGGIVRAALGDQWITPKAPRTERVVVYDAADKVILDTAKGAEPATVHLDADTGGIRSVAAGQELPPGIIAGPRPQGIGVDSLCYSTDVCFMGQIPYANFAFYGAPGTLTGSWQARNGWSTGYLYTSSVCTVPRCYPRTAPNKTVWFDSAVWGTSATIY